MSETPAQPRLMIAGAHSGVGKTTIVAGLIAALRRRGLSIQPFKVGPDYIDPGYHAAAAGRPCRNLDTFLVPEDRVAAMFRARAAQMDLSLIEGVMGVFDGRGYDEETGSSAAIAKLLQTPVVLTLDASRTARSGRYTLVRRAYNTPDLLFDREADPRQTDNALGDSAHADAVEELDAAIADTFGPLATPHDGTDIEGLPHHNGHPAWSDA